MIMNSQKAKISSIVISTPKNKQQNIIRKQQLTDGKNQNSTQEAKKRNTL